MGLIQRITVFLFVIGLSFNSVQAKKRTYKKHRRHKHHYYRGITIVPHWKDIDNELSKYAGKAIAISRPYLGVVYVLQPETGKIIAAAGFKRAKKAPNPLYWARFITASVFKIITSATLIEYAKIPITEVVCYHGGSMGISMANLVDSPKDRACRTLKEAFAHSTNAIFAKLTIRKLKPDILKQFAKKLGFNHTWKYMKRVHPSKVIVYRDKLGLARTGSGFGEVRISGMHAAVLSAIISNGGYFIEPFTGNKDYKKLQQVLQSDTVDGLKEMMEETVRSGTARRYLSWVFDKGFEAGCKTGTLTANNLKTSLMTCFISKDDKSLSFAVISANYGRYRKSGYIALRIARYITKHWNQLVGK